MAGRLELNIIAKLHDKVTATANKITGAFDKIQKHWLAVASAIYATKKAFDFVEIGAKIEEQRMAFELLAESYGSSADFIIKKLKEVSDGTMSTAEIIASASKALTLGIKPDKLVELMEISRAAAKAMGEDISFMFESITMGIARQSKQILDNLGIVFSAEEAYKQYAEQIGKAASELTDFERRQAFANATIKYGQELVKRIGKDLTTTNDVINTLKATIRDYAESVFVFLSKIALFAVLGVKFWQFLFLKVRQYIAMFLAHISRMYFKFFNFLRSSLGKLVPHLNKVFGSVARNFLKNAEYFSFSAAKLKESADQVWKSGEKIAFVLRGESLKKSLGNLQARMDKFKDTVDDINDGLNSVSATGKQSFNALVEASKSAASNIQSAFENFFFDVFKRRVHGIKGLLAGIGNAILQMFSNILAVKAMDFLGINKIFGLFGAGSSVGISTVPTDGLYYLHRGEQVVPAYKKTDVGGVHIVINQTIQAWDSVDVYRNKRALAEAIADEIVSNGKIRGVLKAYG